jgi:hypothetical protein
MNANVHLRVVVRVQIPEDLMMTYYPKVRGGLKALWDRSGVK